MWAMIGIILLAALLRLPFLEAQSFGFDEGYSVAVGLAEWPILFRTTLNSGVHPPLFYILYKPALALWGATEFSARFIAALSGLLTVPLLYKLGEVMFSRRIGLLAALLLAINPIHAWLSQEARMYALLILFASGSMLLFWQALRTGQRRYWIGLTVVSAFGFNLHYFSLLIPLIQLTVMLSNFRRYFRQFRLWVATQVIAGMALLPWLIATARREYQSFGIGFLVTPNLLDLPLTLWNFAFGLSTYLFWPLAALLLALCAVSLLNGLRRRGSSLLISQVVLAVWMFLPLLLVWIISQRRPFYADRYLSFTLPAFILLLAFGAGRVASLHWRILLIGSLLAANVYGLVATNLDPTFKKDNWREVAYYIAQNEQPGDVVLLYTAHIKLPFGYYFHGDAPLKPITFNFDNYAIEPLTEGHDRAWVVYPYTRRPTHYPMQPLQPNGSWDEDPGRNPLLVEWFEAHADCLMEYRHFRGIEMWLYSLSVLQ
jgi:mannosyltransferase